MVSLLYDQSYFIITAANLVRKSVVNYIKISQPNSAIFKPKLANLPQNAIVQKFAKANRKENYPLEWYKFLYLKKKLSIQILDR